MQVLWESAQTVGWRVSGLEKVTDTKRCLFSSEMREEKGSWSSVQQMYGGLAYEKMCLEAIV